MSNPIEIEQKVWELFTEQEYLLRPVSVRQNTLAIDKRADLRVKLGLSAQDETFNFLVECKARSNPRLINDAINNLKQNLREGELPLIAVPYLAPEQLKKLENASVSGIDLCGNGLVIVPNRLYVFRSGQPNLYPDSRPLKNPYRGKSAMVARLLLAKRQYGSLNEIVAGVEAQETKLSIGQVSKAVQALEEDLIVMKENGAITVQEPARLLDLLERNFEKPECKVRQSIRIKKGCNWQQRLSSQSGIRWAVVGESSVQRYASFVQGGALQVAVTNLKAALAVLDGQPEPIRNFADLELCESNEEGFYFGNRIDFEGIRWASEVQTWLELAAGDARQRQVANEVRQKIISGIEEQ